MLILKIFFMLLLIFSLGGCGQTVASDLESQKWEFTAQQHHDSNSIVRFNGKHATFVKGDHSKDYAYKLKKQPNGTLRFILGGKSGTSHRAPTKHFEITKEAKVYKLKPTNKLAKHYYGEVKLVPAGNDEY